MPAITVGGGVLGIRALYSSSSGVFWVQVEQESKCGETDNDAGDGLVGAGEVAGEGIAQEEESGLEHQGQAFHDEVEAPCDHSVHLVLSISTTIDNGSTNLRLGIAVDPLPAQHGDEHGEEGNTQTGVRGVLDVDNGWIGAIPSRESGSGAN